MKWSHYLTQEQFHEHFAQNNNQVAQAYAHRFPTVAKERISVFVSMRSPDAFQRVLHERDRAGGGLEHRHGKGAETPLKNELTTFQF